MAKRKKAMSRREVARKHGFRSGLEQQISESLKKAKVKFGYETEKLDYTIPASNHTYTPDFIFDKKDGGKMYVETKGRWTLDDRKKFDYIFDQHPDIDLRFVFQNPNAKLYKGSKTTYAAYCDKRGWTWAKKELPLEWLGECK